MAEETSLSEQVQTQVAEKPKNNIFNGALRMVKGESTAKLIENFTSEMMLVAEGLCEDQSKLRREVDGLTTRQDQEVQKLQAKIDLLETQMDEERAAHDRDLTELRTRLAAVEKKIPKETVKEKKKAGSIIRDATWLVGIAAAAWVIVTIINAFFRH